MTTEILLPQLGFGVDECVLQEWLVQDGAEVTAGQPLFSVETGKAVQEIEAPASGRLSILRASEQTYPIGTVVGLLK